jgi:hypothetical protein
LVFITVLSFNLVRHFNGCDYGFAVYGAEIKFEQTAFYDDEKRLGNAF